MQDAIKSVLSIGLNDKDLGMQLVTYEEVKQTVIQLAKDTGIESFTFNECQGVWHGNVENTLQVIIVNNSSEYKEVYKDKIKYLASELRDVLNQECIMLETQVINYVEFI